MVGMLDDWYRTITEQEARLQRECEAWLDERYPRWREFDAHWDD